jgi:hypothetical protein
MPVPKQKKKIMLYLIEEEVERQGIRGGQPLCAEAEAELISDVGCEGRG